MPEDIGKELLMLGGTLAGFIAALLTVMEKLIDIRHRLGSRKDRKTSVQQERQTQDSGPSVDFFSTKPFRGTSYLLMYETGVIVSAGLLLNYVGLTLSRHLESILFLDMTGTALVAARGCPAVSNCTNQRTPLLSRAVKPGDTPLVLALTMVHAPAAGGGETFGPRTISSTLTGLA